MTERERRRLVKHRLAVLKHAEDVTGNVAQTCRYYRISRPTFYKWLDRYEEQGLEGLRDRSSFWRPRRARTPALYDAAAKTGPSMWVGLQRCETHRTP